MNQSKRVDLGQRVKELSDGEDSSGGGTAEVGGGSRKTSKHGVGL